MAFQIEKDLIGDPQGARDGKMFRGAMELRMGALTEELRLPTNDEHGKQLARIPFRLLDDDGELYYEGWLHDDWNCDNQLAALTWARIDSGCTTIKVKRGDEWKEEVA